MNTTERFLKYVSFDTQSCDDSETTPSTLKQLKLLEELEKELKELGLETDYKKEKGYLVATLEKNTDKELKKLCLIAHIDTATDASGKDVKAHIVNYKGGKLVINEDTGDFIDPEIYGDLNDYIGKDLIVTDGTTLLGADDKAGVAEIMSVLDFLVTHKEFMHGTLKIAFTCDEEVGRGTDTFDVEDFGADFGYTIDGCKLGEIEYENFNACSCKLKINGVNIHPGSAKNKMINAIDIFTEFNSMLPVSEKPCYTENYEGFYLVQEVNGTVDNLKASFIIRDHDKEKFEQKKKYFAEICDFLNKKYQKNVVEYTIKDSYYNMGEIIKNHFHLIENAVKAMEENGVKPIIQPIRGGTDGARLSYMGLPCPNLSTGGINAHSKYEFIPVFALDKMVDIILDIIKKYS